jgi:peptidyl-tRNA hydrolase, PTH1 family
MYLIVGLGNPGPKYQLTPHNAGFLVIDKLAENYRVDFKPSQFGGELAKVDSSPSLLLFKPLSYMNLSGEPVGTLCRYFKIEPAKVIVIHDDIDVPFGKVKTRTGGGPGGHNGIRSLIQHFGTEQFARIKVGVGRPTPDMNVDVRDWVLAPMGPVRLAEIQGASFEEVKLRLDQWIKAQRN